MAVISNLVNYDEKGESPFLSRYNRQKAVTISARLVGDYSLDEALNFLKETVKEKTPQAKIAYKGESEEYKKTNTELYIIFSLALLTAYLAMCAQFESWRHPLTIMLTVPMAILGGLLGLLVVGSSLNVYSQIALIILIGLLISVLLWADLSNLNILFCIYIAVSFGLLGAFDDYKKIKYSNLL